MAKKLYVGNMSYDMDSSSLQELFSAHGTVVSAESQLENAGRDDGEVRQALIEFCEESFRRFPREDQLLSSASRPNDCGMSRSARRPGRCRRPRMSREGSRWGAMRRVLAAAGRSSRNAAVPRRGEAGVSEETTAFADAMIFDGTTRT